MSEQPGRYQRSMGGLVGALVVTVLLIVPLVLLQGLGRDDEPVRPDPIDLPSAVSAGQQAGLDPVYPDPLPRGWQVTSVDVKPDTGTWGLGMHTRSGTFAGVRLEDAAEDEVLETYVDENAVERGRVSVRHDLDGPVGPWREWTDEGGDTAFVADRGDRVLLVYGSASRRDLLRVAAALTDAPLS